MTQMKQTKWNFFMYTYSNGPTTVDHCAAFCRLHRQSASYPKCDVFVFDPVASTCYMGVISKKSPVNYNGPTGTSDVYYDKGKNDLTCLFHFHFCQH
jgi:hypothetical protein